MENSKKKLKHQLQLVPDSGSPLRLDPFQKEAIEALFAGLDVLVAAPTGTGKTLIAEKLLHWIIESGQGAVYTSPIKALSNQKYRDFLDEYGKEQVGLITGDLSLNETAPLLVMTTEIFRNWCFSNPEMLDKTSHVIFDEIHYLDDAQRGTAWEESIIFAPSHIKILGLSATVPNIQEIAQWIEHIRERPVRVIIEKNRAVPLRLKWITSKGKVLKKNEALKYIYFEEFE
ncbi:MAG: DEAD/DEAH box helicase [Clostridia bacterium]|nr:DEAD/DEAH box helicase [Clostridia bacterium]